MHAGVEPSQIRRENLKICECLLSKAAPRAGARLRKPELQNRESEVRIGQPARDLRKNKFGEKLDQKGGAHFFAPSRSPHSQLVQTELHISALNVQLRCPYRPLRRSIITELHTYSHSTLHTRYIQVENGGTKGVLFLKNAKAVGQRVCRWEGGATLTANGVQYEHQ